MTTIVIDAFGKPTHIKQCSMADFHGLAVAASRLLDCGLEEQAWLPS